MHPKSVLLSFLGLFAYGALAAPMPMPTHHSVQSVVNEVHPVHKAYMKALDHHDKLHEAHYEKHGNAPFTVPHPQHPAKLLGGGNSGLVYSLNHPVVDHNGHAHQAVVKIIDTKRGGISSDIPQEAHNLVHVNQFLGHGHDTSHGRDTHYIVQKHMGVHADQTGLPAHEIKRLEGEAQARYHHEFGMTNPDNGRNNFAYKQNPATGQWQGEVIDWGRGTGAPKHPSDPPAAIPVVAHNRKCPTCAVQ